MDEKEVLHIFKDAGALLDGHFLLTSGLHSPVYWEKFRVLQFPEFVTRLCGMIASHYRDRNIQAVAGPTTGGVILAYETARQMGVRCAIAEKDGTARVFRRGFPIAEGERVLVVDDILSTGGSVEAVVRALKLLKAEIVGAGILVDRSDSSIELGVPLFSCLKSVTKAYKPEDCPLCSSGIPLVKLGG